MTALLEQAAGRRYLRENAMDGRGPSPDDEQVNRFINDLADIFGIPQDHRRAEIVRLVRLSLPSAAPAAIPESASGPAPADERPA